MNQLPISERTVFLDVNGVRAARGISTARVNELVESGELLWAWNIGRQAGETGSRTLRFWAPCVLNPQAVAALGIENVIDRILPPSRHNFNGSELCQAFLISRQTVQRIGRALGGVVSNRLLYVERPALVDFLKARWIAADSVYTGRKTI